MSEIGTRLALIKTTLAAAYPSRVVTRDFLDFSMRDEADLKKGIYTIISKGEKGYQNLLGRAAMDGNHSITLVGQIQMTESGSPSATEDAELAMVDEIKAFLQSLPNTLCRLQATAFRQSEQIDHPYGWVVFNLEFIR